MALDTKSPRSRRALLLGALGGLGALAAQALGRPLPVRAQDELIQVGHMYNTATSRTSLKNATNNATVLVGESTGAGTGVYGSSGSNYGVFGQSGSGNGVGGYSSSNRAVSGYSSSGVGVYGFSNGVGKSSVIGFKSNAGTAVYGEIISTASTDAAVAGWTNGTGPGMRGVNNNASGRGLWGQAQGSGEGVFGESATGIGGLFSGGKAQLKLAPKATGGKPTSGTHTKGEIYMDSNAALFVCTANGTPGTWRKVTTTAT
jgi:hypothetical protein